MAPVPFDTHAVIQQLEGLGFPALQAEGLSQVLQTLLASQDYATKDDIAIIRGDIRALDHRLSALNWSLGLGASLIMGLLLLEMNWLWQLMQRVH